LGGKRAAWDTRQAAKGGPPTRVRSKEKRLGRARGKLKGRRHGKNKSSRKLKPETNNQSREVGHLDSPRKPQRGKIAIQPKGRSKEEIEKNKA